MEDTEGTTVRKTRSSTAKTPAVVTKREKPGPLSRKTRKKVVLMEVEVSDDEADETVETTETSGENNQNEKDINNEKVNGKENRDIKQEDEVVLNDVSVSSEEKNEISTKDIEKMEGVTDVASKKIEENVSTCPEEAKSNVCKLEVEEPEKKKIKLEEKAETKSDISEEIGEPDKKIAKLDGGPNTDQRDVDTKSENDAIIISKESSEKKEKVETHDEHDGKQDVKHTVEEDSENKERIEVENKDHIKLEENLKKEEMAKSDEKENIQEIKVEEKVSKVETKVEEKVSKVETKVEEKINEEETKVEDKVNKEETEIEENVNKNVTKVEENVDKEKTTKVDEIEMKEEKKEENVNNDATLSAGGEDSRKVEQQEEEKQDVGEEASDKEKADPDTENISEDELPAVQAVKVPEAEEVSDEELPGPKRAELPADTEVVSEDELPTVKNDSKKESNKRKLDAADYDPGSPTSENEAPSKKPSLDSSVEKEKEEKPKPKKLPELDKYWKAVNDDPTDFTGWTYLLQYVDQENDMEAAREAYDAFLSHYPYCYGYWRKYADYEKRKGNKKKCEEVFERGLKAIPLSVDLWIHYLTYVKGTRTDDEEFVRSQFERALVACGLEFRSDRLWDSYIKWETEGKRLQKVTAIYDRLLGTPTQGYTAHFENFQTHISHNPPNKVVDVDEFLALRKEVRQQLKHEATDTPTDSDAPPGDEDQTKAASSDEETKILRERIISIRRKLHKNTITAVTARWNYEEAIKRPYFHVKPLERCQLKNWQDYLDYETEQGDRVRIIVLFERCLIACALYEEFWLKFVYYLENLRDHELQPKIRDVYERACTIHHLKKPNLHLQWAMFEEGVDNASRAAEILVNLEKSVPNGLQIAYRRINLERRRGDHEKCCQLFEHYINSTKNKMIASSISTKYARFVYFIMKDATKAQGILKSAIGKDQNNARLYLQLVDLTLHKGDATEKSVTDILNMFLDKDGADAEQKMLFAQRKLEYLEDFGSNLQLVQEAQEQFQKLVKQHKDTIKKKEIKSETTGSSSKSKETKPTPQSSQGNYGNYSAPYGPPTNQPSYPPYSGGSQQGPNYYGQYGQGDQYQYQNWQYPQGGYGGYNQWGGYGGGYGGGY